MDNMDKRLHATIRDLLPGYVANQLSTDERRLVEQHLATCTDCEAELRQWQALAAMLAEAEAAIPFDATAVQGLAAIHSRLHDMPTNRTTRRATNPMDNSYDQQNSSTPREQYISTDQRHPAPYQPRPQRRVRAWLALASVAAIVVLAAGLFYLFSPQFHHKSVVGPMPTATATIQPTPTATQQPTSGSWHTVTNWPAPASDMGFSSGGPTGYLCTHPSQVPKTSSQWLYKTSDGGMSWQPLGGITTPNVGVPVSMQCNVFVDTNDASDVFVQLLLMPTAGATGEEPPVSETLWRSQNGGAIWQQLQMPNIFRGWASIVVVGSRIVGLASYSNQFPPVCGTSALGQSKINDLYASDDGGITWRKIGQSIISQGLSITSLGMNDFSSKYVFTLGGPTLFVQSYCEPKFGSPFPNQQTYWESSDEGASWTKFPVNGIVSGLQFSHTSAADLDGVAVEGYSFSQAALQKILFSSDSGNAWTTLPPLTTLPGLHPVLEHTSVDNIIVLPDGSVLADVSVYDPATKIGSSAIFVIHPQDATPKWQRYASATASNWQLALTGQGYVLWGWSMASSSQLQPVYLSPLP